MTHHSLAVAVSLHSDRRHRTLRVEVGGSVGCLQIRWITSSVSTRTETSTCSRLWSRRRARLWRSGRCPRRRAGTRQALRFAAEHAAGRRVWAVEGAGHYGAGLARHLSGRGETALEAGRGPRNERRLQGKDDQLDAIRAARTVLVERDAGAATRRATTGGSAAADGRSPQCRRCPSGSARAAAQRDRDRTRRAPPGAARAARGAAARALQPLPPLELTHP